MIPTPDQASGAALTAINYLDINNQEKGSVSNTRKFKYIKEIWFCKEDDNGRGKREAGCAWQGSHQVFIITQ